jgi:biotin carboxyl carrier protein
MTDRPPGQPDRGGSGKRPDPRSAVERAADHAALERLADELLPALVAKLGATGLGELEVREGAWRVRLRRPAGATGPTRRGSERPSRSQPGHESHGHPPVALEGRRPAADPGSRNGYERGEPMAAKRAPGASPGTSGGPPRERIVATSPSVGIFQPGLAPGARVRAGDRVAIVDLLGLPQDVISPIDGIVGATLVEAGDGVEYGEPLVVVQPDTGTGER